MFSNEFQGGPFVDLMPSGSNPLANWKLTGPQKSFQKVYDKDVKGYIHQGLNGGGSVKLQIPKDDKATLGLLQPFLVLQVLLPQVSDPMRPHYYPRMHGQLRRNNGAGRSYVLGMV